MPFFLRKSVSLGRFLRLNLSKSGVGLSAGVKGLRLGVRADGQPYGFAGRGGLYWRENLGTRRPGHVTSFAVDFLLIALGLALAALVLAGVFVS